MWREDAVEAVLTKRVSEVSAGYRSKIVAGGGAWQGQQYDLEQTDLRYNHVALLPAGAARGGAELAIRMDSHDLITLLRERLGALGLPDAELATALGLPDADGVRLLLDGHLGVPSEAILTRAADMIHLPVANLLTMAAPPSEPVQVSSMKRQITINGVTFEVELADALAGSFDAAIQGDRASAQQRTDALESAQAERDELKAERDELKTERDAQQAPCDAADLARVRDQAVAAYPEAEGETARELHLSVLEYLGHGDAVRADASDAEVAGMFALATKVKPEAKPSAGRRTAAPDPRPDTRTDAEDTSAAAARQRMLDRNRNAWRPQGNA